MTTTLEMLAPHQIPSESSIAEWTSAHAHEGLPRPQPADDGPITNSTMACEMYRTLAAMPPLNVSEFTIEGQPDDMAHDAYFHIRRVEDNTPAVFIRMVFAARLIFLLEVAQAPVSISDASLQLADRALADLISCLFGGTVDGGRRVSVWESQQASCDAMARWVRGHQLFAALTQGLIFSFQCLASAVRAGRTLEVQKWSDLSISLLRGSSAAFELTGDFSVGDYTSLVRPSMSPPASPVCLSGLMSADHRFLVQTIRKLQPVLRALSEQEPQRYARITAAVNTVYDNHIHVCERFVGSKPSLLTEGRTEKSGPELLEQFKTSRLKPFEHAPRSPRGS